MNPVTPSPNADWGYDVADYCDVDPALGTLADLDTLIAEAAKREIRLLLDLVPNHTSDRHPWFVEARAGRDSPRRDWYVWALPGAEGSPPNNWLSAFGGPAWTLDERSGEYYLHGFLAEQPDLNWWNAELRAEFDRIMRFWFDRGVAGFRIDVAHKIVKDRRLRDNEAATADDHPRIRASGQRETFSGNQPEVHDVFRRWRRLAEEYDPPRLLLGETYVLDVRDLAAFYGDDDELQLAFNFLFVHAPFDAEAMSEIVAATEAALPAAGWPVWTGSNHDAGRFASRWSFGDEARARCALLLLLTLRGTPVLYYGDEIAMTEPDVPPGRVLDPVGLRGLRERGRDPGRTPMHWSAEAGAGFTESPERAWLPIGDTSRNVESQRDDPDSVLTFCRDLIALRRRIPDLRRAPYEPLRVQDGVWAWRRGDVRVGLNLSDSTASCPELEGEILVSTEGARDRGRFDGRLQPWQGILTG